MLFYTNEDYCLRNRIQMNHSTREEEGNIYFLGCLGLDFFFFLILLMQEAEFQITSH